MLIVVIDLGLGAAAQRSSTTTGTRTSRRGAA